MVYTLEDELKKVLYGEEKVKTFKDLKEEVIETGKCGSCLGCVTFCSAGQLNALTVREDTPDFLDEDKCLECGICYLICPNINLLDSIQRKQMGWIPPIGTYIYLSSSRSENDKVRALATDGGVVTSLLHHMLDHHIIDGALVSKGLNPFSREPFFATTFEDLLSATGFGAHVSGGMKELERYSTYPRTLVGLRSSVPSDMTRIAVVGTPCQINTIRKMQLLKIIPAHIIKYTIGLFCIGTFFFYGKKRESLEETTGIPLQEIAKMNIKEDLRITTKDGETHRIPLEKLERFLRPPCRYCTDFSNEFADISVGGLGSPDGYTTVLLREPSFKKIYDNAIREGYLAERDIKNAGNIIRKIIDLTEYKKKKSQAYDGEADETNSEE